MSKKWIIQSAPSIADVERLKDELQVSEIIAKLLKMTLKGDYKLCQEWFLIYYYYNYMESISTNSVESPSGLSGSTAETNQSSCP